MQSMSEPQQGPARILGRAEADQLITSVLGTMGQLEKVLADETAHVRVGRIREGLAAEARKSELASAYLRGLEVVKSNAIALARFAPDALARLKTAHAAFSQVIQTNQTVLATARAVSENLLKSVADEVNRLSTPQGYAPAGPRGAPRPPPKSEPLLVSKRL
ncbi:MAG TPA: hypothetical protein VH743_08140 [Beijerinckiaceae bacterium]|jgi:hypothetical protein